MNDIESRGDVQKLVEEFYAKVMVDDVIGYIFTHYAKVNLETHLPVITDFWDTILFERPVYKRGPKAMNVHIDLAKKVPLRRQHFDRWVYLFHKTVDEMFGGDRADKAKTRASSISETIQKRIGPLPDCRQDLLAV